MERDAIKRDGSSRHSACGCSPDRLSWTSYPAGESRRVNACNGSSGEWHVSSVNSRKPLPRSR